MASVYVTQLGSGTADGSSLANAIAIGDLTTTEWNLPARSADGAERVYFYGNFTSRLLMSTSGTSDTDRLWVDCSNAVFNVVNNSTAMSFQNARSYIVLIVGTINITTENTTAGIYGLNQISVTIKNGTINNQNSYAANCMHFQIQDTNLEDVDIDNIIMNHSHGNGSNITALNLFHTATAGHSGIIKNLSVRNSVIDGGKLITNYTSPIQQVDVDGRLSQGITISGCSFRNTASNAIQISAHSDQGELIIENNTFSDIGSLSVLTNAIQINYVKNAIVRFNTIDNIINGVGPTGDGGGIIVDWWTLLPGRPYSENCEVYGNVVTNCNSVTNKSGGISIYCCINAEVYGNVCENNQIGIKTSDPIDQETYTLTGVTSGADTTIDYSPINTNGILPGDTVVISGTGGLSPTIDGTHTAKTGNGTNQFTIELSTSGTWDSSGTIDSVKRATGIKINNNTMVNNAYAQLWGKQRSRAFENIGNIMIGGEYGYLVDFDVELSPETHCVFFNNNTDQINDSGTPVTIDSTSVAATKNPLDSNNKIINDAEFITKGFKWWTGPNPTGSDGEPFSDFNTDPGANQSTFSPLHPKNL